MRSLARKAPGDQPCFAGGELPEVGRLAEPDRATDRGDGQIGVDEEALGLKRDSCVDGLFGRLAGGLCPCW